MNVVDLHPENLLSKEIRGELDAAERQRLDAHLEECATCRLERKMREDFAQVFEREAVSPKIADLVDALARGAMTPPDPPIEQATPRRVRGSFFATSRGGHRNLAALLAVAALTVGAGAFAAMEPGRRVLAPLLQRIEAATVSPQTAPPVAARPRPRIDVKPSLASNDPAPSPLAGLPALPEAPASPMPPEQASVAAPEQQSTSNKMALRSAAALFDDELGARGNGNDERMLELHAQLVARYPQSHQAQVSHIMVSRILLNRGDSAGALNGFDAYLRAGSSTLREDALAGRASALDRLGRREDAQHAWTALLDQYPDTAYAAHARMRIEALGGR